MNSDEIRKNGYHRPDDENKKSVGKVVLDYSKYQGADLYCDGEIEQELLDIVKDASEAEYSRIIEEKKEWPVLYHLSPQRENIVDFLPILKSDKVLEIGSGCGAITGKLSNLCGELTCVDLSKQRSLINANRHQTLDNVTIHVGNFTDIEPDLDRDYDWICLIGVFEYGQSYISSDNPFEEFLNIIKKHVKKDGRIVIAIENRLGMKYFAGCMEDHLGTYFSGIEDYANGGGVRTFSRPSLENIFKACGYSDSQFFYPYPDYKFMHTLYSDKRLPLEAELNDNKRNFDRDRMELFSEKYAFDGVIRDGVFPLFSNSYLVVLGNPIDLIYAKYSNDRDKGLQIVTTMECDSLGKKVVIKRPACEEAKEHLKKLYHSYELLADRYEGSKLSVNKMQYDSESGSACFEYVEGKTLEQLMDNKAYKGDMDGFMELFGEYVNRISYGADKPVTDYDLIFANILVDDDKWTIIDYEWTFEEKSDPKELAFRAIYCYILAEEKRNECLDLQRVMDYLGIDEKLAAELRDKETKFQKQVTGKAKSMAELLELIGGACFDPKAIVGRYESRNSLKRIQIYEDKGIGYSEDNSYFITDVTEEADVKSFVIHFSGDVKKLRIDPCMESCLVRVVSLVLNGMPITKTKKLVSNGKRFKEDTFLFVGNDPNIEIPEKCMEIKGENTLEVSLEITAISDALAKGLN